MRTISPPQSLMKGTTLREISPCAPRRTRLISHMHPCNMVVFRPRQIKYYVKFLECSSQFSDSQKVLCCQALPRAFGKVRKSSKCYRIGGWEDRYTLSSQICPLT